MEPEDLTIAPTSRSTLRLDAHAPADLRRAAVILRAGGTVAFPTETVYGLGANALHAAAVATIFEAKQRPAWDPLIVHVSDFAMLAQVAIAGPATDPDHRARNLIDAFWPGPLTLLLPRTAAIPDAVTAGRTRVGVRMPAHPVALALIAETGLPIAAPSANRFGRTSPTTAAHVLEDLDGRIDAVLDAGSTSIGLESTVLDPCAVPMRLYRPGAITPQAIAAVAGEVEVFQPSGLRGAQPESLPSPGVGIRHYAPRARLHLVEDERAFTAACGSLAATAGAMVPTGWDTASAAFVFPWGDWNDADALAQRLFAGLRALDQHNVSAIICPLPADAGGLTSALRDRLRKAAREA